MALKLASFEQLEGWAFFNFIWIHMLGLSIKYEKRSKIMCIDRQVKENQIKIKIKINTHFNA